MNPAQIAAELAWLQKHPHFEQKPASIVEFLGPGYLDIESKVRPGIRQALVDIFGEDTNGVKLSLVRKAMVTGAIGIGKTTLASIALSYMVHWVLCLRDPQDYFGLLPGSRIAFMEMSTSEDQAADVVFGDIKARIEHSQWFIDNYTYDTKFTKEMHFPKDIWVLPGDSAETTFEGYNILGGILDEADSHKVTQTKDYAEAGYDTIESRISSRFEGRGLIIVIGQMKKANGFAARKYKELLEDPEAHTVRMTIWESRGWDYYPLLPDGERDSFFYDPRRKRIVPTGAAKMITDSGLIEIPSTYITNFRNDPEKALRDLAGIPPATGDPFISLEYRITEAQERWHERFPTVSSPVGPDPLTPHFEPWFKARDSLKRVIHIDLAYSSNGDACGVAMGHVREMRDFEGESKPYIVFDCLMRIKAPPGGEIMFSDIRRIIYFLKDQRRFKIVKVTLDGFQSQETIQQLRKRRFAVDYQSVDKTKLPYEDLREALYEERIEFPRFMTYMKLGDTKQVNIAYSELSQLTDTGKKVDHPPTGSKDVADAMAGVVYTLMGGREYQRGVVSYNTSDHQAAARPDVNGHNVRIETSGLRAPVPSRAGISGLAVPVPPRLRQR